RIQLEREGLGEVPLLCLEHLHLDHLRRTDVLAEPASDAVLLAGLLIVGQRQHAPETIRVCALDVRVVDRDRPSDQVDEGDPHRAAHRRAEVGELAPEALSWIPTHRAIPNPTFAADSPGGAGSAPPGTRYFVSPCARSHGPRDWRRRLQQAAEAT